MTTADSVADAMAHAFDFWLGEWEVHDAAGNHVGRNSITDLYGTGALAEHWRGDAGVVGHSLSAWDVERGCWHQTWMDSTGTTLLLDGGLREGAMVMEGTVPTEGDAEGVDLHRITWTPSGDGAEVRQLWESSADGGATWTIAFDGRYRRA
jgi:hypothetical protein